MNPLLPKLSPKGEGVREAVVFLRKIDAARSRPWNIPPARIEMEEKQIAVVQGDDTLRVNGFVRAGDAVEIVSRSSMLEMLRARGAAFFTIAFPEPEKSLKRVLSKPGVVEFSSANGNFWARSFVHVVEHPYITRSDDDGNFVLDQVPDGDYELVCWMPNWRAERFERDPENLYVSRLWFAAPLEKSLSVTVRRGEATKADFTIRAADFAARKE